MSLPSPPHITPINPANLREIILRNYRETVGRLERLLEEAELERSQSHNAKTSRVARNKVINLRQRLAEARWALGRVMKHHEMG